MQMMTASESHENVENVGECKRSARKALSTEAKSALKVALGSMLVVVASISAPEDACATSSLGSIKVTANSCKSGLPVYDVQGAVVGCDQRNGSGGGSGSGGGGSPGSVTLPTVNVSATTLKCAIKQQDWKNVEYISFVYMNNGAASSALVQGGDSVSVVNALNVLGIRPSQIISMVHNHPFAVYCTAKGWTASDPACIQNNSPSSNDWNLAYSYIKSQGGFSNGGTSYGQYILGIDGNLRYFQPGNQNAPPSTATPPGTIVGSGNC